MNQGENGASVQPEPEEENDNNPRARPTEVGNNFEEEKESHAGRRENVVKLSTETVNDLARELVKAMKVSAASENDDEDEGNTAESWIAAEDRFIYRPCTTLGQDPLVPRALETQKRKLWFGP